MDEESAAPCIQDRLRSIISRARGIFEYLQIFSFIALVLGVIAYPEILTLMSGREVIIPIFSQISLEGRFGIFSSIAMIVILLKQNKINKLFLTVQQQRELRLEKKEHDLMLIGEPLDSIRHSIRYYSDVITNVYVNLGNGEIFIPRMGITDNVFPGRISREEELLHEHLNNGYPQLLQSIYTYQDSYNGIAGRVNAAYQKGMDLLVQSWETEKLITMGSSPKIFCAKIINAFKDEVYNRLYQKHEPNYAHIENTQIIKIGSQTIQAMNRADAIKIERDINLILEGSEVYEELKKLWEKAKLLRQERELIDYDIARLVVSVNAGIPLEGWCSMGIAANYEHSHE